jgi:hypothetical protein
VFTHQTAVLNSNDFKEKTVATAATVPERSEGVLSIGEIWKRRKERGFCVVLRDVLETNRHHLNHAAYPVLGRK